MKAKTTHNASPGFTENGLPDSSQLFVLDISSEHEPSGISLKPDQLHNRHEIDLSHLQGSPFQPRKVIREEELEELTASVLAYGVLQPVIVQELNGKIFIVAGQRRFMAAKRAGLAKLPVVFLEGDPDVIALVENLQRSDLSAIEEAEAIKSLKENGNYTIDDISAILGKSRASISESIQLTKLPKEIKDECRGDITVAKSILVPIARIRNQAEMKKAYASYRNKAMSRDKVRKMAKDCSGPALRPSLKFVSSFQKRLITIEVDSLKMKQRQTMKQFLINLNKNILEIIVKLDI